MRCIYVPAKGGVWVFPADVVGVPGRMISCDAFILCLCDDKDGFVVCFGERDEVEIWAKGKGVWVGRICVRYKAG